jgi:hypothetical protein
VLADTPDNGSFTFKVGRVDVRNVYGELAIHFSGYMGHEYAMQAFEDMPEIVERA